MKWLQMNFLSFVAEFVKYFEFNKNKKKKKKKKEN